jgi:hypothetical protein
LIHSGWVQDRPKHHPSDTSDEQWAVIEPLLPAGAPDRIERYRVLVADPAGVRRLLDPLDHPPAIYDAIWPRISWNTVRRVLMHDSRPGRVPNVDVGELSLVASARLPPALFLHYPHQMLLTDV